MNMNNNQNSYQLNGESFNPAIQRSEEGFAKYIAKTYFWMFIGLLLSFGIGIGMYLNSGSVISFMDKNLGLYLAAVIASIILVIVLGFAIKKMSATVARVFFLVYAALFGVVLAPTLLYYELSSVIFVMGITAAIYLVLAVIGLKSKRDMSKFGNILFVSLIALFGYSLISIFLFNSPIHELIIGIAGIAIFMGFTIYDSNKIKKFYFAYEGDNTTLEKLSIVSALQLYLDYVNLFLYLLRFMGKARD